MPLPPPPPPGRVTTVDAARILGITTRDVYDLVDRREIAGYHWDSSLIFDQAELEQYRDRRT